MVWENIYINYIIAMKDIIHVHFTFLQIHSNDLIKEEKKTRCMVEQEMDEDETL